MSNPAVLGSRIFRFGLRFSLFRNNISSIYQTNTFYHSYSFKKSSLFGHTAKKFILRSPVRAMNASSPNDPNSFSRPELAVMKHMGLKLNVDFDRKVLSGSVLLKFEALKAVDQVVLDTSSLNISAVELENGTPLKYKLDLHIPNYGSRMIISLPQTVSPGDNKGATKSFLTKPSSSKGVTTVIVDDGDDFIYKIAAVQTPDQKNSRSFIIIPEEQSSSCVCDSEGKISNSDEKSFRSESSKSPDLQKNEISQNGRFGITVRYATEPSATGLQWLEPSQTAGKKHPYLFSQCQPIHARSIVPCQDTPSVKVTYEAEITAPEPFTVLMSALTVDRQPNRTTFRQPMPLPSYLLAIAVGVLESRSIGPRSKVWTEKEDIDRSAREFALTEQYLQAAERLCGPYVWQQYDLLVLPPSFPYGGMENPCLTFVTPTLLAGDRSQADVIVHEIMHSWTGNLVTTKSWEHFWLNEGFTVFLERKVGASLIADSEQARRSRDFFSILGMQELEEAINEQFTPRDPLTKLVPDLKGVHPDDAFSRVPYEKGSLFLRYLEDLVGGPEVFDDFLRSYLENFKRQSIDTDQFKAYLLGYFADKPAADKLAHVQWDQWLYAPGMPPVIPNYDTSMTQVVTSLLERIAQNAEFSPDDVKDFSPHQMIHLLQELTTRAPLPADRLEQLGARYGVAGARNAEIRYRWLRLCVRSRLLARLPEVLEFVSQQGRMKYVRPLYRDLYAWEEVRQRAIDNFLENERNMMHVSAYTVRKDLHLTENILAHQ